MDEYETTEKTYELYRLFGSKGELLYIGISDNVSRRLTSHRRTAWGHRIRHVVSEPVGGSTSARDAERAAIQGEKPMFNQVHNVARAALNPARETELQARKNRRLTDASRQYATLIEAAEYLGVTTRTLRRYIAEGRVLGYRVGSRVIRVRWADLDKLFAPIPAVTR